MREKPTHDHGAKVYSRVRFRISDVYDDAVWGLALR
jgi:hypothetical protein